MRMVQANLVKISLAVALAVALGMEVRQRPPARAQRQAQGQEQSSVARLGASHRPIHSVGFSPLRYV